MRILFLFLSFLMLISQVFSQTNMSLSNPTALQILKGNYNSSDYNDLSVSVDHNRFICDMKDAIDADTLENYLLNLTSYHNRNTFSDTMSNNVGIGGARRWAMSKMKSFDPNGERLVFSYLDFDVLGNTCGDIHARNVLAIRPGTEGSEVVVIEAHMDSRCGARCDPNCKANGADDNGSGSVLVLELARVMNHYQFPQTIVFMLTVGEEQGLLGGRAFSDLAVDENIPIRAVFNNDIVGGVMCGETASPPTTCAAEGSIDSTRLRIFASPTATLGARNLARWVKLNYEEKLVSNVGVPMQIQIMNQEDRTGRGGDHIPFREDGFNALRFTSAVEHGNGSGDNDPNYHDRQHSVDDVIGVDTDVNGIIDSFFVDFNYLARNSAVNALSLGMAAFGPPAPEFTIETSSGKPEIVVSQPSTGPFDFRLGVYELGSSDTIYQFTKLYRKKDVNRFVIPGLEDGKAYIIQLATVKNGVTSVFSRGSLHIASGNTDPEAEDAYEESIDCKTLGLEPKWGDQGIRIAPNPTSNQLKVELSEVGPFEIWEVRLRDLKGSNVLELSFQGKREANLNLGLLSSGTYLCQVIRAGQVVYNERVVKK
jgi:hypothetical protein